MPHRSIQQQFHREHKIWKNIRSRCKNPTAHKYSRRLTLCDRWQSFAAFIEDMGPAPTLRHTIDRKDNDGPYCRENCRWATRKEQSRNVRTNRMVEFRGERKCMAEWGELIGVSSGVINRRLKIGWSVEKALTTPKLATWPRYSTRDSLNRFAKGGATNAPPKEMAAEPAGA